jgi:hypothetical protein
VQLLRKVVQLPSSSCLFLAMILVSDKVRWTALIPQNAKRTILSAVFGTAISAMSRILYIFVSPNDYIKNIRAEILMKQINIKIIIKCED